MYLSEDALEKALGQQEIKSKLEKGTDVSVSIPCNTENQNFKTSEVTFFYYPEKEFYDIEFSQFHNGDYLL